MAGGSQCGEPGGEAAVEIVDPKTEEPRLYCGRCAERVTLGYFFKRLVAPARRVHADDTAMMFIAVSSDGGPLYLRRLHITADNQVFHLNQRCPQIPQRQWFSKSL